MALPASGKLTAPARILYRGLRRLGTHYDKYALLKAFYVDSDVKYVPTKSFEIEIRNAFRGGWVGGGGGGAGGVQTSYNLNDLLADGFCNYRYLNTLLEEVEIKKPWYRKVTGQFIETKLSKEHLNVKTRQLPCITDEIKPGVILIAHPHGRNDFYAQTVVLILRHDKSSGTTGLILDRAFPTDVRDTTLTYWTGGPLSTESNLLVLHTNAIPSPRQISQNLYYTYVNKRQIMAFIKGIEPSQYRIYNTSSEWSPGQLQMELSIGGWFLASCPDDILFDPIQPKPTDKLIQTTTTSVSSDETQLEQMETSLVPMVTTPSSMGGLDLSETTKTKYGYNMWKKVLRLLGGEYAAFSFVDGITDGLGEE